MYMCTDISLCINMCAGSVQAWCVDMYIDMCIDMHIGMCIDMHIGMCIDMHIGMHIGMCIDMCIDMVTSSSRVSYSNECLVASCVSSSRTSTSNDIFSTRRPPARQDPLLEISEFWRLGGLGRWALRMPRVSDGP